jgi:thiol-disulfide isomerase/thioredoxin
MAKMSATMKYGVVVIVVVIAIVIVMHMYGRGAEGFESGANTFTLYYADWCPHCKTVKPIYAEWSKNGSIQVNGQTIFTSMVEEGSLKDKSVPVKGYPTFLLKKPNGTYVEFNGERTPQGWETWLAQNV